ncbi:YceD family protein [Vulgatibacter incomptus]|uniref:DUF177 domain-containing protein n=1 Tax=Vulgatibacter incomptus TaxID=1391653 RepID=A0A0K1PCI8_9BACT|nr:DUF177 domain-containing protein [Vulgatibacter incomptus]AKU91248.1 hypothetical protein AKJ08_1635 [Vulgatibacter incomptus]
MDFLVKTDQIKAAPLRQQRELRLADLDGILHAEPPTAFRAAAATTLGTRLERVNERDIVFEGDAELRVETDCKRCLAAVPLEIPLHFLLDLVDRDKVADLVANAAGDDDGDGEIGGSFAADDANQILYSGREIDLAPIVREQILLALPMDSLCRDDCKGLCQVCGLNLNEGACSCDQHVPDPRWAGLKGIKIDR